MTEDTNNTENTNSDLPDELTLLKQRADQLGIPYHHKNGVETLKELINQKLNPESVNKETEITADEPQVVTQTLTQEAVNNLNKPKIETQVQKNTAMRKEASRLVRIRVTCMNPNKKEHEGEIFTCGNSIVGTFKKYVPFNNEAGWHVPHIIYQMMVERQCQIFYTVKGPRGNKIRKGKLIREFAIEVLDDLSPVEIKELAEQQALAHNID